MVTEYGMSPKFGMMYLGSNQELFLGRDYQSHAMYSEKIAGEIDDEVRRFINENYERALKVLKDNIDKLHIMARVLLEKETIYTAEVDMIMDGKSFDEVIAYINEKAEAQRKVEEEARKEREKQAELALQELKEKAQRALYEAGVVSEPVVSAKASENAEKNEKNPQLSEAQAAKDGSNDGKVENNGESEIAAADDKKPNDGNNKKDEE